MSSIASPEGVATTCRLCFVTWDHLCVGGPCVPYNEIIINSTAKSSSLVLLSLPQCTGHWCGASWKKRMFLQGLLQCLQNKSLEPLSRRSIQQGNNASSWGLRKTQRYLLFLQWENLRSYLLTGFWCSPNIDFLWLVELTHKSCFWLKTEVGGRQGFTAFSVYYLSLPKFLLCYTQRMWRL